MIGDQIPYSMVFIESQYRQTDQLDISAMLSGHTVNWGKQVDVRFLAPKELYRS